MRVSAWPRRDPNLDGLPRLRLNAVTTPLVSTQELAAALGGPALSIKRDDLIPFAFGGNKVRGLDLIVADAMQVGADTLVTGAGPLSNHVRATAEAAAFVGLRMVAVSLAARAGGMFLDPTYTGKALAGYRAFVASGRYRDVGSTLFLHTGGASGLFVDGTRPA